MKIDKFKKSYTYTTKLVDGCCEIMRLAVEEWDCCNGRVGYFIKKHNKLNNENFSKNGFYIYSSEGNMPIPIKFCPWCGKEIVDGY